MKRRDFIKQSGLASSALFIPSFLKGMQFLNADEITGFRNLIVVQLSGGNDGLNTIVPIENDLYRNLRPNISRSGSHVLKLSDSLGLNSACSALRGLHDNGELSIINNVGYPNPNRSHFRSTDIWHTASNSEEYLKTGWIGRFMDANCNSAFEGIEVDSKLSLVMKGKSKKGIALTDPQKLFQSTRESFFKAIADETDQEMLTEDNQGYLYKTLVETYSSAEYIYERSKIYQTSLDYPNTSFSKKLKGIGDMINSGLKTRMYYTSLGGFDSHVNQHATQERLLTTYAEGIAALVKDLKANNRFKDTLIVTFSEFGRRVKENGSRGTDHGTANNLFLVGGSLKKAGFYNEGPDLSDLDSNGDLKYSVDFRSVYASILENWLEVDANSVLGKSFDKLDFI